MGFSTLNESDLHNTLKVLYSELYEGQTEVEKDGHIYDIVTKNGNIIEIQTKNISKLKEKIKDTIDKGHNIKIVHPIILTNTITLYDEQNNLISKRKSPKKENIYDIFKELTGIVDLLSNPHFSLEIVEISMIEERLRTTDVTQSKNNRRRFRKNWNKTNKKLEEIINTRRFSSEQDYLNLLPELPEIFSSRELKNAFIKDNSVPKSVPDKSNIILWVLSHSGIIEYIKTEKRIKYYKLK